MQTKKQIARDFLLLCAKGGSRIAFTNYTDPKFKHHNAHFKGDAETLMLAMEEAARDFPNTVLDIKHILEDGNMVAVHSCVQHRADSPQMAVMHILRFENNKIVELWDFGQQVPTEMVNENGMF